MITRAAPAFAPEDAAARAAAGTAPVWLRAQEPDRHVVACDPVETVRGDSVASLQEAWTRARARWAGAGAGVPVGIGHLSYDLGRTFLPKQSAAVASSLPVCEVRFFDALWVAADDGGAHVLAVNDDAADRLCARLSVAPAQTAPLQLGPLTSVESPQRHLEGVRRVLDYIRAGDVYQVNLARRLTAPALGGAGRALGLSLAARLQSSAPAPFSLWMCDDDAPEPWSLIGNSPERFLRVDGQRIVETEPIKGTRPRGDNPESDARAAADLVAAEKDRAEHAMIVDLERNDLGRVCEVGSVAPVNLFRVVSLPTVHHLVSTVRGQLRADVDLQALLRATFPGGSITGAPKVRAMQIIDELESAQRGPYTGATGWLGAAGDLDLAVAIRTAWVQSGALTLWVGGGVVADSDPDAELAETNVKAEAFRALCGSA